MNPLFPNAAKEKFCLKVQTEFWGLSIGRIKIRLRIKNIGSKKIHQSEGNVLFGLFLRLKGKLKRVGKCPRV
jgi:hypothetical protein